MCIVRYIHDKPLLDALAAPRDLGCFSQLPRLQITALLLFRRYPDNWNVPPQELAQVQDFIADRAKIAHDAGKPFVVEEYGMQVNDPEHLESAVIDWPGGCRGPPHDIGSSYPRSVFCMFSVSLIPIKKSIEHANLTFVVWFRDRPHDIGSSYP